MRGVERSVGYERQVARPADDPWSTEAAEAEDDKTLRPSVSVSRLYRTDDRFRRRRRHHRRIVPTDRGVRSCRPYRPTDQQTTAAAAAGSISPRSTATAAAASTPSRKRRTPRRHVPADRPWLGRRRASSRRDDRGSSRRDDGSPHVRMHSQ